MLRSNVIMFVTEWIS